MAVHVVRSGGPWWAEPLAGVAYGLIGDMFERTRQARAAEQDRALGQLIARSMAGGEASARPSPPSFAVEEETPAVPLGEGFSGGLNGLYDRNGYGRGKAFDAMPIMEGPSPATPALSPTGLFARVMGDLPSGMTLDRATAALAPAMAQIQAEAARQAQLAQQAQAAQVIAGLDPRGDPAGTFRGLLSLTGMGIKPDPEILKNLNPAMTMSMADLGDSVRPVVFDPRTGTASAGVAMARGVNPTNRYVADAQLRGKELEEQGEWARHTTPSGSALVAARGIGGPKMVGKKYDPATGGWNILYADGSSASVGGGSPKADDKGLLAAIFGSTGKDGVFSPGIVSEGADPQEVADDLALRFGSDPGILRRAYELAYGSRGYAARPAGSLDMVRTDNPIYGRVPVRVAEVLYPERTKRAPAAVPRNAPPKAVPKSPPARAQAPEPGGPNGGGGVKPAPSLAPRPSLEGRQGRRVPERSRLNDRPTPTLNRNQEYYKGLLVRSGVVPGQAEAEALREPGLAGAPQAPKGDVSELNDGQRYAYDRMLKGGVPKERALAAVLGDVRLTPRSSELRAKAALHSVRPNGGGW